MKIKNWIKPSLLLSLVLILTGTIMIGASYTVHNGLSSMKTAEPDKWYQTFHVNEDGGWSIYIGGSNFKICQIGLLE